MQLRLAVKASKTLRISHYGYVWGWIRATPFLSFVLVFHDKATRV